MKNIFTLLILQVLVLSGCQTTQHHKLLAINEYSQALFQRDSSDQIRDKNSKSNVVEKWIEPVRYFIIAYKGLSKEEENYIHQRINHILPLTGVAYEQSKTINEANFKIYVQDKVDFIVNQNQRGICYAKVNNKEGVIWSARIFIAKSDMKKMQDSCLDHEIMHAIGLPGHPHRLNSALSYYSGQNEINQYDEQLIKFLYSDIVKVGMSQQEMLPIIKQYVNKLELSNLFSSVDIGLSIDSSSFAGDKRSEYYVDYNGGELFNGDAGIVTKKDKKGHEFTFGNFTVKDSGYPYMHITHYRLKRGWGYPTKTNPEKVFKAYENLYKQTHEIISNGKVRSKKIREYKYIIVKFIDRSCLFYSAFFHPNVVGFKESISGLYCDRRSNPINTARAERILRNIDFGKRSKQ